MKDTTTGNWVSLQCFDIFLTVLTHMNFPVIHKIGIFVLLEFENKFSVTSILI